ncbi:MAG: outer membrane protein assembly factor BamD [Deltaproteobacteria bacterium]|nr:outer membrane protein assembly factor BamD [Deltaproteobacteria bacterium]
MRIRLFVPGVLLFSFLATGCSWISMPWSKSEPVPDPTSEALFEEGTKYFKDKRYVRAIDSFTRIKTDHPFSPLLSEAELKIADAHYLNEQYPEAINAFKEFQSLHPASEHIPFVTLRLGQAYFNQFTHVDREQKNTELAKGYFEAVLANYPKSPHAAEAKEKLAKCNGILAQHDFNIAEFYFKQEKYPAARDRFEEIVRKYPGTPVASKSLFYLGGSYRSEGNNVKAALAYEALLGHYPNDKYAAAAKTQLAQIEKEKQDPLAMLLMRDRRPAAPQAIVAEEKSESARIAKLRETNNLVTKTEVVYEAPGAEKGFVRRVVDKINPFASSDNEPKIEEPKSKGVVQALAKKSQKEKSGGFFSALWPFGGESTASAEPSSTDNSLVSQIDDSLKKEGLDTKTQTAALKTPAVDLPSVEELQPKQRNVDTAKLLGQIDSNLKKDGMSPGEMPSPPEAAQAFRDPEILEAARNRGKNEEPKQSAISSGLLSSIDQQLKSQGVEPPKSEAPPAMPATNQQAKSAPAKPAQVNLEPKSVPAEKGPLFLNPEKAPVIEQTITEEAKSESASKPEEQPTRAIVPKETVVRGPQPRKTETPAAASDEDNKSAFDQLSNDLDSVGKVLNPFRW